MHIPDTEPSRTTARLRLEPVSSANAHDLWLVHNDDDVARWYNGGKPSLEEVERAAKFMDDSWRLQQVHKWLAYDRETRELVGRGGLSRTPTDEDWDQVYPFLPPEPWVRLAHESDQPRSVHARWLEIGWALRAPFWGRGYASEIGRAGLAFAFEDLGVDAVVSCTVRHNARSLAVMQRIGMRYVGEILSRGRLEGSDEERDDAPFALCIMLREDWNQSLA